MRDSYLADALAFLVTTVFDLYILVVMLRFLFQWVRADFYNPVSQFVVQLTNPPLRFLRRFVPGLGGVDLAALVLMLALKFLERWVVLGIQGVGAGPVAALILAVADLIDLAISVFMVSVLVQVPAKFRRDAPGAQVPRQKHRSGLGQQFVDKAGRQRLSLVYQDELFPLYLQVVGDECHDRYGDFLVRCLGQCQRALLAVHDPGNTTLIAVNRDAQGSALSDPLVAGRSGTA